MSSSIYNIYSSVCSSLYSILPYMGKSDLKEDSPVLKIEKQRDAAFDLIASHSGRAQPTQKKVICKNIEALHDPISISEATIYKVPNSNIFSDADLQNVVKSNPDLTDIDLTGCPQLTNGGLACLQNLPSLRSLNLTNCIQINVNGLSPLLKLRNLAKLILLGCTKIDDQAIETLFPLLNQLITLSLGGCTAITEIGWKTLSTCEQLQQLDIEGCIIKDSTLAFLSNISTLQSLNLSNWVGEEKSTFTDEGLKNLSKLKKLANLYFAFSSISDEGLKSLCEIEKLANLSFSYTTISNIGVANLSGVKNLHNLYLTSIDSISGSAGLENLVGLPLTTLDLGDATNLTDVVLPYIGRLTMLHSLNLGNCWKLYSSHDQWNALSSLQNLTELDLTDIAFPGCMKAISGIKSLEKLSVFSARITAEDWKDMASLTALVYLNLSGSNLTDEYLAGLLPLQNLQKLALGSIETLSPDGFKVLPQFPKLQMIDLSYTSSVNDVAMGWVSKISTLTDLDVSSCPSVTDVGVQSLTALSHTLRNLNIGFTAVTNECLDSIKLITSLESLDASNAPIINIGLNKLASLQRLQSLRLANCRKITDDGLENLLPLEKSLREIDLIMCSGITKQGVEYLYNHFPNANIIA